MIHLSRIQNTDVADMEYDKLGADYHELWIKLDIWVRYDYDQKT